MDDLATSILKVVDVLMTSPTLPQFFHSLDNLMSKNELNVVLNQFEENDKLRDEVISLRREKARWKKYMWSKPRQDELYLLRKKVAHLSSLNEELAKSFHNLNNNNTIVYRCKSQSHDKRKQQQKSHSKMKRLNQRQIDWELNLFKENYEDSLDIL